MTTERKLGVWMDHSSASLMEFAQGNIETTKVVESKFTQQERSERLEKSEKTMHNAEQQQQSEYYKQLGEAIKNYENIIVFGPGDAKMELCNLLKKDNHFANKNIEIQTSGKMTEGQRHAFVRDHFTKK